MKIKWRVLFIVLSLLIVGIPVNAQEAKEPESVLESTGLARFAMVSVPGSTPRLAPTAEPENVAPNDRRTDNFTHLGTNKSVVGGIPADYIAR